MELKLDLNNMIFSMCFPNSVDGVGHSWQGLFFLRNNMSSNKRNTSMVVPFFLLRCCCVSFSLLETALVFLNETFWGMEPKANFDLCGPTGGRRLRKTILPEATVWAVIQGCHSEGGPLPYTFLTIIQKQANWGVIDIISCFTWQLMEPSSVIFENVSWQLACH